MVNHKRRAYVPKSYWTPLFWRPIPRSLDFPSRRRHPVLAALMDWFIVLILVALIIIFRLTPAPSNIQYFRVNDPALNYPDLPEVVNQAASFIVLVVIPVGILALAQAFLRDWDDFHTGFLTYVEAILFSFAATTFLWFTIGGLRPKFLAQCKPDMSKVTDINAYYSTEICTGFNINELNGLDSAFSPRPTQAWPSGHAANILAAGVFIIFYLNGKWKTFDKRAHLWKLFLLVCIFMAYLFIGLSRLRDFEHNNRQVITGIIIGIVSAMVAYALNYCSFLGPDNHIPCRKLNKGKTEKKPESQPPIDPVDQQRVMEMA